MSHLTSRREFLKLSGGVAIGGAMASGSSDAVLAQELATLRATHFGGPYQVLRDIIAQPFEQALVELENVAHLAADAKRRELREAVRIALFGERTDHGKGLIEQFDVLVYEQRCSRHQRTHARHDEIYSRQMIGIPRGQARIQEAACKI